MPWPAALTVRTLHGKIVAPNVFQTPAVGDITFHLPFALRDSPDNVIVGPQKIPITLVGGEFTTELPAVDDPDISPINWAYKVVINTDIWKGSFFLQIPSAGAPATLELADLAPAVTPPALITYALAGHTHAQYIPYGLLTAKGSLIVATGMGTAIEQLVGVDGRVLTADAAAPGGIDWKPPSAGGGGFKGVWDPLTVYQPGESVVWGTGYYSTAVGAAAGVAPFETKTLFTGVPTTIDVADAGDYQFRGLINVTLPPGVASIRCTGLCYYKTATQIAVPHELRIYDPAQSTATTIASGLVTGEVAGAVGIQTAPVIADLLGRPYAITAVVGAGADQGYAYTPGFAFPLNDGAMSLTSGGFSNTHANINAIINAGTYYGGVSLRWEQPSPLWTLTGRFDPVIIDTGRAYKYPIIPA